MPRNRQAFSQLKRTINSTGFVAAEGTPAGNYLAYLKNERERGTPKLVRVTAQAKGRLRLGLIPFDSTEATVGAGSQKESGYITIHSAKNVAPGLVPAGLAAITTIDDGLFGTLAFTKLDLGAYTPDATTNEDAGFYSAAMNIKASNSDAAATRQVTSGITGRKYSYRPTGSATIPFGKVVAADNIQSRFLVLKTAVTDGGVIGTISLLPEKRSGQKNVGDIA